MTDRRPLLGVLVILALAATLAGYYWIHKPITPQQAGALFSACADLGVALWLTLLGGGLGRRFIADWEGSLPGERLALQAALGWGTMGLFLLGFGLLGLYYPLTIWTLLLLASLWLWRFVRAWLADVALAVRAFWPADSLARWATVLTAPLFALSLLRALAPPLMWDALVYHLTLPKLYAETHTLKLNLDFMFSGMPQLAEMLYTGAVLVRGLSAAQTLGWMFGAVLALGLAAHAARLAPRLAPLAPALIFSSFSIALALAWAYVEMLLMLMALALLVALRQWQFTRERRWLVFAGLFAGFAMGCKYTAAILPLAATLVILLTLLQSRATPTPPYSHPLLPPASFLLTILLTFSPWLLKNLLFTGNLVYPLLFPAGDMDALRQFFYSRPDLVERNPLWAGLIFFRAVLGGVQGGNGYDATLNPALAFLPLALLPGWRRLELEERRELAPVVIFVLTAYGAWVALTFITPLAEQTRLFFALFPALALLCVGGLAALAALDTPALRPSFIVRAALGLVFILSALEYGADFIEHQPLAYLSGQQGAAEYREQNLGWYAVAVEKVNALPAGSRVVFLWEVRSLDCLSIERCAPDVIIDRWWHLRRTLGSADDVLARWQAQGFTHVLIYDTGVRFLKTQPDNGYDPADWAELETLQMWLRLVEQMGDAYSLYAMP
jgi:hypothetical protein